MHPAPIKMITDATLVLPQGQVQQGTLLIEGNRIHSIQTSAPGALLLNREDVEVVSGKGCFLTPGLTELHFNGALGCDLNQASISEIQQMLGQLPKYGITSLLLTALTAPLEDMITTLSTLEEAIHYQNPKHSRILGIHLEGPFLNPQYRGTHPIHAIRPAVLDDLVLLTSPNVKMVTLAPEKDPQFQLTHYLLEKGIRVSAGHTAATLQEMTLAISHGIRSVTHLFNAMRPLHHREPGIIAASLNNDLVYTQFIGDGVHVHPEALRTLLRCKPANRLLLVSDSLPLAGLPEGSQMQFAGTQVTLTQGQAFNTEGSLAGSGLLLDECLRNLVRWKLLSFPEAIPLVTTYPSEFLGRSNQLGRLEAGQLADLVLWDQETMAVQATWINGELVYNALSERATLAKP